MSMLDNAAGIITKMGDALVITVITIIFCAILLGIIWLALRYKAYKNIKVHIYKRTRDKEGHEMMVFVGLDKAKIKYHKKLKRRYVHMLRRDINLGEEENLAMDENRDLDLPTIPNQDGGEVLFVEKLGKRKYAIATPFIVSGDVKLMVSDADVAEAIRSYDSNAAYYGKKGFWEQYGPMISSMIAGVFIIILVAIVLQRIEVFTSDGIRVVLDQGIKSGSAVASGVPG